MAKSNFFGCRKRNRKKHTRRTGIILVLILAAGLFAMGVFCVNDSGTLPALAQSGERYGTQSGETLFSRIGNTAFLRILSLVLPGFGEAATLDASLAAGETSDWGMALPDPRDPKQIMSMQIPYMGNASLFLQPVVNDIDEGMENVPQIIVPLRTPPPGTGKIIIYHTHTTESFLPTSGRNFTDDLTLTVAALGEELAGLLKAYGLQVVHDKTIHDIPRNQAYVAALPTIGRLLEQHPDTALVIDLHRDGVNRGITTAKVDGENLGRLLFVVGARHENWPANSRNALYLHEKLEEIVPGLSRGVRERPLVYNQHVHPGSLLIEVGGHENSMEEARRTLPYLARAIQELYKAGR